MQPEECKAISKAVGDVYESEQVRLLLQLHHYACGYELALACDTGMHGTIDGPFGSVAEASTAYHPKAVEMLAATRLTLSVK